MRALVPTLLLSAMILGAAGCGGEAERGPGELSPAAPLAEQPAAAGGGSVAESADNPVSRTSTKPTPAFPQPEGVPDEEGGGTAQLEPCRLVLRSEARAILGRPIAAPVTAPQGPTCIYEQRRDRAVTLAVEARDFEAIRRSSRPLARVRVDDRNGYCVEYGSVMMYVPLASGRVLNITAPCTIAARFAAKALPRLAS